MTEIGIFQIAFYLLVLLLFIKPLGWYMGRVYLNLPCGLNQIGAPVERFIYRMCGIEATQRMRWKTYLSAMFFLNIGSFLIVYGFQRFQASLPLNPEGFSNISPILAFNTAISFISNTNWQAYSGETQMSYLTQMMAFTVQNFVSAATGMSLLIAVIRGISSYQEDNLGNFWVDTVRGILYILLPISIIFALILASQGVIQNLKPYQKVNLLQPIVYQLPDPDSSDEIKNGNPIVSVTEQVLPMGPVSSQTAIKQLGTNGGGFFNTSSSHPFENPNPLTNFLEMLAILLIPAALCYTFGMMVNDKRQGWAILITMLVIFIPFLSIAAISEQKGNPAFTQMGIDQIPQTHGYPGGNMEGKETRFGIISSALWATATTATANGSVNSMHDSYTPIGGLAPLWMMNLGEVVFGGVGSGLYGMLMLIIITVFIAGLMVGRTPEYLGKKIEPHEIKMAATAVLIIPITVLLLTAIAAVTNTGISSISNPGAHGFSEIFYAFSSLSSNNGSAFAGLKANTPFYNILGGVAMLIGRYWVATLALALAGSLAKKKILASTKGTLPTHTPLFIILLVSVILLFSALSFLPALALGPIIEHLMLWRHYG